jgi:hypothetical protein
MSLLLPRMPVLTLLLGVVACVHAQPASSRCAESGMVLAGEPEPEKLHVAVGPDVRGLAGFSPALVITVSVPSGGASASMPSAPLGGTALASTPLELGRGEYWNMGTYPRASMPVVGHESLPPISERGATLYKFYFKAPLALGEAFEVRVPTLLYGNQQLAVPVVRFQRGSGKSGLALCFG